jgi:DNA-binding MltR family transcriptional regulator
MSKRTILPIENLSKDSQKLFDVLNEEKDLSVILIATSFIDACLGSILKNKLIKSSVIDKILDVRGGILGTYSARADVCYTLGLINKPLYQDLTIIGSIRNGVAHHHLELDFDDPTIIEFCSKLSYVSTLKNGNTDESLGMEKYMEGPRNQFTITVVMISQRLLLIGLGVKRGKAAV